MAEYSAIYEDAIDRITSVYASCSKAEQKLLRDILTEMGQTGYSYTLEKIWLADFKELPVGINQFLDDPQYLGEATNKGKSIYPYWRDMMQNVFDKGNQYNEIILSGATRIGKTSTGITILAYMLYKLMLYRDPHTYFDKKPTARFTLIFANLTKDLAEGVAFFEFNSTIKESKWFMDHGCMNRSVNNPIYLPEGDKINILPCSDAAHALGMQVWGCLKGDTKLLTTSGLIDISQCSGTTQEVVEYSGDDFVVRNAEVKLTKYVRELIRIELEDGTIIEGTPDHKVMLTDGKYKQLCDLTSSDDLLTFNISEEVDHMNLKDEEALFSVYEHVSPKGKRYVGITSRPPQERWGKDGIGYKSNIHFWNAICKYGWNNFEHNILASNLSLAEACEKECALVQYYDLMNPDKGYNHTSGGNWSHPDEETRNKLSRIIKQRCADPEYRKQMSERLKGHTVPNETREKISMANKGRKMSEEFCDKQRNRKHSPETIAKLKGHSSWCKGLTKETDERVRKISESLKRNVRGNEWKQNLSVARKNQYREGYSPMWINNGQLETTIQKGEQLPEGFSVGRLDVGAKYIHKDGVSKRIKQSELSKYLAEGWLLGRPSSIGQSIRSALVSSYWEYDGMKFDTAKNLAEYLHSKGYPNIVDSTITSLYRKGFASSKKYNSLEGKIRRISNEDKIDPENNI